VNYRSVIDSRPKAKKNRPSYPPMGG
jgi:hypothetical protein